MHKQANKEEHTILEEHMTAYRHVIFQKKLLLGKGSGNEPVYNNDLSDSGERIAAEIKPVTATATAALCKGHDQPKITLFNLRMISSPC